MRSLPPELSLHTEAGITRITPGTFYEIARLRQEVFVVEQECAYLDLDGRDLEPGSLQLWVSEATGAVVATLRVLPEDAQEPGLRSIGRVATAPAWRGRGVAGALVAAGIAACAGHPVQIHAQSYLTDWYARFGFAVSGPEFLEDGIPHTPMRRAASALDAGV